MFIANISPGDVRDAVSEHGARQGPNPQHTSDPSGARNQACANAVENSHTHLEQSTCGTEEAGMSEEEESMIQETPMALMANINDQ